VRTRLLVPALLLPIALAPTASADPTPQSAAYVNLEVRSGGHAYDVRVLAVEGRDLLRVQAHELGSESYAELADSVPGGIAVTDAGASVKAVLGGVPLSITWSQVDPASVASAGGTAGGTVDTDAPGASAETGYDIVGHGAVAKVSYGAATCTVDVWAIVGTTISDDAPAALPLSKAPAGLAGEGATCTEAQAYSVP
jgi:hypothetical protein